MIDISISNDFFKVPIVRCSEAIWRRIIYVGDPLPDPVDDATSAQRLFAACVLIGFSSDSEKNSSFPHRCSVTLPLTPSSTPCRIGLRSQLQFDELRLELADVLRQPVETLNCDETSLDEKFFAASNSSRALLRVLRLMLFNS